MRVIRIIGLLVLVLGILAVPFGVAREIAPSQIRRQIQSEIAKKYANATYAIFPHGKGIYKIGQGSRAVTGMMGFLSRHTSLKKQYMFIKVGGLKERYYLSP